MNRYIILISIFSLHCKKVESPKTETETPEILETTPKRIPLNEIFYNHSRDGLNVRDDKTTSAKKIGVLPYKAKVIVLERSYNGSFIDSEALWYNIKFQNSEGWVSGWFLSTLQPETTYEDFKGGCLHESCDSCDSVAFKPDHTFEAAIGCHYGRGKGTWSTKPDGIYVKVTYVPSCYDSCKKAINVPPSVSYEAASKAYQLKYTHSAELRFFQTASGMLDFETISSSLPDQAKFDLPKKPLSPMRPHKRDP